MKTTTEFYDFLLSDYYYDESVQLFGEDYSDETRKLLYGIHNTLLEIWDFIFYFTPYFSITGIILNILHIFVLTRKSMLNNSINLILVVLALNDIFVFLFVLNQMGIIEIPSDVNNCVPYDGLTGQILSLARDTIRSFCSRNVSWLAVLMAGIRAICVAYSDIGRFSSMTTIKFGAYASLSVILLSSAVSSMVPLPYFIYKDLWLPEKDYLWVLLDETCPKNTSVKSSTLHALNYSDEDHNQTAIIDGITITIIPSFCYPILTIFLVRGLRKANRNRKKLRQNTKSDHTSAIVIGMTVSFMIAEVPRSMSYLIQSSGHLGFIFMKDEIYNVFSHLTYFNSCIHCFICFSLSSNYRNTVLELLWIRNKKCGPQKIRVAMKTTGTASFSKYERTMSLNSTLSTIS